VSNAGVLYKTLRGSASAGFDLFWVAGEVYTGSF
jgi:hypothetical protein